MTYFLTQMTFWLLNAGYNKIMQAIYFNCTILLSSHEFISILYIEYYYTELNYKSKMDASTQQKQKYLRQQILQSSYDADQFVNFLCKDLEIQQLDVQNHTMKELQAIVFKFKQYKYYQEEEQPNKKKMAKVKIDYQNNGTIYDYQFNEVLQCNKKQELINQIQVFIPKFQITQSEGLFFSIGSKTEIWFILKSNLNKEPVKRLQADFQWIFNIITKLYPTIAIPQLITVAKQFYDNHEKRRRQLEQFIQILAKRQELRSFQIFYDFLTLPYEKLQKFKKHSETLSFSKGIQSIQSITGNISISLDNKLRNYVQSIPLYNRKTQAIHENIAISIEKTLQLYKETYAQINKIVNYYAQLHECYNEVINKYPQQKINDYSQILVNINNLFHTFSDNIMTTSKIIQTNFKQFHKITINYDKSIGKLYKNVMEAQKQYTGFKLNLNRRKQRIYPDVSKWQVDEKLIQNRRLTMQETFDLMLPKETEQQMKMKRWMAYLYVNFRKQFEKQINFEVKRYVGVSCTFCSQILLNNKNFVEQITKFIEQSHKIYVKQ